MAGDAARNGTRHRASRNSLQSGYRVLRRPLLSGPISGCCDRARRNCAHIPGEKCPRPRGRDRRVGGRGGRSSDRDAGQFQYRSSRPDYRTDGAIPYTEHFSLSFCRERREPDVVRHRLCGSVSTHRRLRRPYSQGHEAGRASGASAHQVRAGHQSAHSQNARPHRFPNATCPRRRGDRMKRRTFITLLGAAAVAWPLAARAQQPSRVRRVAILMPAPKGDSEDEARVRAFKQELAKLGWTEGSNVRFDERWTADNMDRVRAEAAGLVASNPDIIVTYGGRVIPVFMRLTHSIPIVLPTASDPVGVGYAQSLARPGGNVTGFSGFELSILGKSLEILKQIAPAVVRVALIYNPDNSNSVHYRRISEAAAAPLAIEIIDLPIHNLADIDRVVTNLADRQNSGIFFLPDTTISALRDDVVGLVARRRVPAIYSEPFFVKLGGLAFYGPDRTEGFRGAAGYVDRILRGEKPGDLPFQQPTKYKLMINRTAAKALGLELSPALLALADEVIE